MVYLCIKIFYLCINIFYLCINPQKSYISVVSILLCPGVKRLDAHPFTFKYAVKQSIPSSTV